MKHELKMDVRYFQDFVDGKMTAQCRYNDRCYQVGDEIVFREGQLGNGLFVPTGRTAIGIIKYVDMHGCQEGYVNLSLCVVIGGVGARDE